MIDFVARELSAASASTLLASTSTLICALIVLGEVLWIRVVAPQRRVSVLVSLGTGTVMAAGAVVVGIGCSAYLRWIWPPLLDLAPHRLGSLWDTHVLVGFVVAFVAWDAIGWVYHWLGHCTAVGWAAHQPHHTGTHFDITLGLRQSWTPLLAIFLYPLMALLGFELGMVVAVSAVSNVWQLLEHSSVDLRFPRWFSAVVMTPGAHRQHHVTAGATNLGPVLTVWDRVAGTWVANDERVNDVVLPDSSGSINPFRLELAGWVSLATARTSTKRSRSRSTSQISSRFSKAASSDGSGA